MSILEPGWVKRAAQRRRERRWRADAEETVKWATLALKVPALTACCGGQRLGASAHCGVHRSRA